MPYDSRVYRVLIASPSDVEQERELAVRVIQDWNDLNSYSRKVVLLPLRWETHTAPEYGTRPQEPINRAIVDDCDLLVGVFWTRIGTATGEAESGTLEEIERVANVGKPVMLYFSQVGIDPYQIDSFQQERLKHFRDSISAKALTESYKSHIEFRDKFFRQLEIRIRDVQIADSSAQPPPLNLQLFSTKEKRLMTHIHYDVESIEIANINKVTVRENNSDHMNTGRENPKPTQDSKVLVYNTSMLTEQINRQNLAVPLLLVVQK